MKKVFIVTIIFALALSGCKSAVEQKNEQLREEIIRVHDLAMDKIGYMYELEVKLEESLATDTRTEEAVDTAISHLRKANTIMFDWMHQYQTLAVDNNVEKDSSYREQQLLLIKTVQQVTDNSIRESEQILKHDELLITPQR